MIQAERRHDRLAVRLSLIISRLVAGETLSVRKLAAEFGVSVRTLRRDFRERLMYLDLEYQSGYLNQQNQLIAHETLFAGSISSTEVHPARWSNAPCTSMRQQCYLRTTIPPVTSHPARQIRPSRSVWCRLFSSLISASLTI